MWLSQPLRQVNELLLFQYKKPRRGSATAILNGEVTNNCVFNNQLLPPSSSGQSKGTTFTLNCLSSLGVTNEYKGYECRHNTEWHVKEARWTNIVSVFIAAVLGCISANVIKMSIFLTQLVFCVHTPPIWKPFFHVGINNTKETPPQRFGDCPIQCSTSRL